MNGRQQRITLLQARHKAVRHLTPVTEVLRLNGQIPAEREANTLPAPCVQN